MSPKKVISLLLNGYSITEVAEKLQVSRTTIYNRRKEFLDYAKKEGFKLASENFDVEEDYEELFAIARNLKSNGLRIDEALKGSEIAALLKSIDTDDPVRFIEEIIREAKETDITGDEITKYTVELRELEEKENKSYSQLIHEIDTIGEEKRKSEKNLESLKEQVEAVKNDLEESLQDSETTKILLESHISTRNSLSQLGLDFSDLHFLENLLTNTKDHGYDLDKILDFYGSMRLSRSDLERNTLENSKLVEHNKTLLSENYAQEEKIAHNLSMAVAVKNLKENKIQPEDILEIIETVSGVAKVHNVSMEEAIEQFINDIKTQYTERRGYTFQLEDLERLQKTYQEKNSLLKEQIDILEEVLDERKNTVESLKRLEALGVDDAELIEWGKLVKDLEYDLSIFRDAMASLGGIPDYRDKKLTDISLLEVKEEELEKTIKGLEERIWAIQSTLDLTREAVESNIIKINQTVQDFEDYFVAPESGLKARNIRMINEVTMDLESLLTSTKIEWGNDVDKLNENVEKIIEETSRILESAYQGGRLVGRFHALEPIHKILREENVTITEGTIGVITMLTYIQIWLKKNYPDEEESVLSTLITRLMEDLGNIY